MIEQGLTDVFMAVYSRPVKRCSAIFEFTNVRRFAWVCFCAGIRLVLKKNPSIRFSYQQRHGV